MSIKVSSMVWRARLPSTQKLVAARLADFADDDGCRVFPSNGRVATECGLSDRAVRDAMRALEAAGVLILVALEKPGQRLPREYRFSLAKLVELAAELPTNTIEGGTTFPPEPPSARNDVPPSPEPRSPDPSDNHHYSEEADASPGADGAAEPADRSDADLVWGNGLKWLAKTAGKKPDALRSLVGRWCKGGREAVVLSLMRECREHSPPIIEPIPWIETALANRSPTNVRQAQAQQHRPAARSYGEDPVSRRRAIIDGLAHRMEPSGTAA